MEVFDHYLENVFKILNLKTFFFSNRQQLETYKEHMIPIPTDLRKC